jgi:hypothetical protein
MTKFILALVGLGLIAASAPAVDRSGIGPNSPSSQPANDELQLTAHLVRGRVEPAEPVVIQLTIRNVSKHEVKYMQAAVPEYNFIFNVKSESGRPMPLTLYGGSEGTGVIFGLC